jgi:hypothetical protein
MLSSKIFMTIVLIIEPTIVRIVVRITTVSRPLLESMELITDFWDKCYVTKLKSMGENDDFGWTIGVTK